MGEKEDQIGFVNAQKKLWRTLIVEDNATFRQTLRNLLFNRFPFINFDEAKDGEEVFRKIGDPPPDLIFMDIKLPGENGLQITKKLREIDIDSIIIVLTTYDLPEYREAAVLCGANYFVSKGSSSAEEILELVDSILSAHFYPKLDNKQK